MKKLIEKVLEQMIANMMEKIRIQEYMKNVDKMNIEKMNVEKMNVDKMNIEKGQELQTFS